MSRSHGKLRTVERRYRLTTLGLGEAYTGAAARFELAESRMASLQRGRTEPETERSR